jgi:hypothetical protein
MQHTTTIHIGATGRHVTVQGQTHDVSDHRLWRAFCQTLVDAFAKTTGQKPFRPKRHRGNHRRRQQRKTA